MNLEQLGPIIGPILLIMATLASCVLVALRILERRNEKRNGGKSSEPGYSPICEANKTAITELKTTGVFIAKEIAEINTSIGKIWSKINGG